MAPPRRKSRRSKRRTGNRLTARDIVSVPLGIATGDFVGQKKGYGIDDAIAGFSESLARAIEKVMPWTTVKVKTGRRKRRIGPSTVVAEVSSVHESLHPGQVARTVERLARGLAGKPRRRKR